MPTKAAAFHALMSSFGIPAYAAGAVPEDAVMPYITYTLADGALVDGEVPATADVWYRTTSEAVPNAKVAEIGRRIGPGGAVIACDGGGMWVKRGYPWAQPVSDDDPAVKRRYLNLSIEYLTTF